MSVTDDAERTTSAWAPSNTFGDPADTEREETP